MVEKNSSVISVVSSSYLACGDVDHQKSSSSLEVLAGVQRNTCLLYTSCTGVFLGSNF